MFKRTFFWRVTSVLAGAVMAFNSMAPAIVQAESYISEGIYRVITVTSPMAGAYWRVGDTQKITWNTTNVNMLGGNNYVQIGLQAVESGNVFTTIVQSIPNTGSYTWAIPTTLDPRSLGKQRIVVIGNGGAIDKHEGYSGEFTMLRPSDTVVFAPAAGETWRVGESHVIRWLIGDWAKNLSQVRLSVIGPMIAVQCVKAPCPLVPSSTYIISESAPNTGEYRWTIPADFPSANLGNASIALTYAGTDNVIQSGWFSIIGGSQTGIKVTSPVGGEVWSLGEKREIRWSVVNPHNPLYVRISLVPEVKQCVPPPGASCTYQLVTPYVITEYAPNSGSYVWFIPQSLPQAYLGKATIMVGIQGADVTGSSGVFNISMVPSPANDISISSPAQGDAWGINDTNRIIRWVYPTALAGRSVQLTVSLASAGGSTTWTIYQANLGVSTQIPSGGEVLWSQLKQNYPSGLPPTGNYTVYVHALDLNSQLPYGGRSGEFKVINLLSTNLPPVITGGTAPSTLRVGEEGTWSINAYDPEQGYLSYSVNWGDNVPTPMASKSNMAPSQTATFTHSYANAGTYTVVITVTDDKGASVRSSYTVAVGGDSTNHNPVFGPVAVPAHVKPGENASFFFNATDADDDNLSWSVEWGDGSGEGEHCLGLGPVVRSGKGTSYSPSHAWKQSGLYQAKINVTDCRGGSSGTMFTVDVISPDLVPVVTGPTQPPVAIEDMKRDAAEVREGKLFEVYPSVVGSGQTQARRAGAEGIVSKIRGLETKLKAVESPTMVTDFVAFGTSTTQKLGAGERAGVVASFAEAYNRVPTTSIDWEDVVKIANGRFPTQVSSVREQQAEKLFLRIYKRVPQRTANVNDAAAVTVMAYGLRPASRNTGSEVAAIKTFKSTFGYTPSSAADWDSVRAIAYSGATR